MITLIGIGSRACADDAIGLRLVETLRDRLGAPALLWEDHDALDIASNLLELDAPAVLVDCADMRLEPGSWRAFDPEDARLGIAVDTVSTHGFGLSDALRLARTLGYKSPLRLFGVQPFEVRPGRPELSPTMEALVEPLSEALWREAQAQEPSPTYIGRTLALYGVVQGVGMRPTLAREARTAKLGGWVLNRSGSVLLRLEGPAEAVDRFVDTLADQLPTHARVDRLEEIERAPIDAPAPTFEIRASAATDHPSVVIPADLATCPACLAEVHDPADRRFGYAFTTCTDCGPRYTVVERTPYDRERTTLQRFPLCPACAREYADEGDRRFHAESTACPECGPRLTALSPQGEPLPGDPLRLCRAALHRGELVALRGIGGFALAVDAQNPKAIARLRQLKRRPDKPLALMAADLDTAARACLIPDHARAALTSAAAPIVLLELREGAEGLPLDLLSPDTDSLGVMLPTSPLHDLLFHPLPGDPTPALDWLVMTSGNRRGEPICLDTAEALERLDFADLILTHDREIAWRCDDSVVATTPAGAQVRRRARGYAPDPIRLARPLARAVLALGAGLKNTVAFGSGERVVLSPHIGDLSEPATARACEALARSLPRLLGEAPEAIAVDLHPDLPSTRLGERLAAELDLPLIRVQHHHAHAAACLGERGVSEGLALVFDGVGLGDDGQLWGGELLHICPQGATRLGTLAPAPLPGGDAATVEPARQLVGRLVALDDGRALPPWLTLPQGAARIWRAQCRRDLGAPQSHAVGRLFDAVAAALGLSPTKISWEGQAAVRLERAAQRWLGSSPTPTLELPIARDPGGIYQIDWRPLFSAMLGSVRCAPAGAWALGFHRALADASVALVLAAAERYPSLPVALTGGVFQNRLLTDMIREGLRAAGRRPLEHAAVPPNDGGIAFGQAIIAGAPHTETAPREPTDRRER